MNNIAHPAASLRVLAIQLINNLPPLTGAAAQAAHALSEAITYCPNCGRHYDTKCYEKNGKQYFCGEEE